MAFAGLPGNASDWIAIARQGAPLESYVNWFYADAPTGGRHVSLQGLNGRFVVRAFANNGYELLAESASFSVNGGASVATNAASYSPGATIEATYASLPGNARDWITIAPGGAPLATFGEWAYVAGASGTYNFGTPAPGTYVLRVFENDTLNLLRESAPFVVGYPAPTTNRSSYTPGAAVTVSYSLPGNVRDWITIAEAGSDLSFYGPWAFPQQKTGTYDFHGLKPGTYVARSFENNTFHLLGESAPFTVAYPTTTISSDASTYVTGSPVTVTFASLRGNAKDWISLAPTGSPLTTYGAWFYAPTSSGMHVFEGLAAGSYVARAFENDGFELLAESASFTIAAPAKSIATSAATYAEGASINVSFAGLPGNVLDWLAIAPVGAPASTYVTWTYAAGAAGQHAFANVPPGTYVARAFANNGYELLAESSSFEVSAGGAAVAPSELGYVQGQSIPVTFSGMPGNDRDWLAIATVGSAAGSFSTWAYTYGQKSGKVTFPSLPPGTYTVRAFFNDGSTIEAESATFTVAAQ